MKRQRKSAPKYNYQTWATDRHGGLIHAGPRLHHGPLGPSVIRRFVREWEAWADGIARESPGCGTDKARRKQFYVCFDPQNGQPPYWFYARTGKLISGPPAGAPGSMVLGRRPLKVSGAKPAEVAP